MANQRETDIYTNQSDTFAEALATARKMQQDWLNYGLDFIHLYVEDVDGDWLETWGNEEILGDSLLDIIKEFLVSDDDVAVRIRQYLERQNFSGEAGLTLFDIAVNLEECWRIPSANNRLSAMRNLLAAAEIDETELWDLTERLLVNLTEILDNERN